MKSKREIPNEYDYLKAYSYNLILTEKTNCELEDKRNVGKIDGAFYRIFSWQIMGKQKERQISDQETKNGSNINNQDNPTRISQYNVQQQRQTKKELHIVESRNVYNNNTLKRYVTTCYFKQKTVPSWYSESLVLDLETKKKTFDEKVFYMNKLQPSYWSESVTTEVNSPAGKTFTANLLIPVPETGTHYVSLEPQQQMPALTN
ncbi:uncharacterized protein LOC126741909 [Anthonomus grandis grandis]|uniref:uncharacterized protein LOC126741909 n=1 Tax=Anthonomus grandis grandis TaxID=2921223 RepID=UPI002166080F|nr:uncharacterized protein LOC126741909 [Anthonomus grandis grandis]